MESCGANNCNNIIKKPRKYCSASCRTKTTNILYKNYEKEAKKTIEKNKKKYKVKYCLECNKEILYENRENKFCNHSCSAKYSNKTRKPFEIKFSKEGIESIRRSVAERWSKKYVELKNLPKVFCGICGDEITKKRRKFCSKQCVKKSRQKDLTEKQKYRSECKFQFSLNEYPDKFDFSLIEKYGWYKASNHGNNLNGVSRDHMFSITDGFKLKVPVEIIRHPANCQLLRHGDNLKKNYKSCITYEQLLERIERW